MRKNIYDNKIVMINRRDTMSAFGSTELFNNQLVAERLRLYSSNMEEYLSKESKTCYLNGEKEFGILIKDEIDEQLIAIFEAIFLEEKDINLTAIKNAYLHAVINKSDIRDVLETILVAMQKVSVPSRKTLIGLYGEESLNYILAHQKYEYEGNCDFIAERDKNILLCSEHGIEKIEISTEEDYSRIIKKEPTKN